MANTNAPYGFRPLRHRMGGVIRPSKYRIASASATAIYRGDPVKLLGTGYIDLAAAGNRILGIFAGCNYVKSNGDVVFTPYWPAAEATLGSADVEALVYDDPNITYSVQSGVASPALADIGALGDHVAGTGSAVTGNSGAYLSGTIGTGTAGFRILDFVNKPDNEIAQYADVEVQLFESELAYHGQGTIGV